MTAVVELKDEFPMPTHAIVTLDEILEHMGDQTAQTTAPALPVIGPSTGRPGLIPLPLPICTGAPAPT